MKARSDDWKEELLKLKTINWSKQNHDWDGICIIANSVVSNRQARAATKAYIKRHLGLELSDAERRSLQMPEIMKEVQELLESQGSGEGDAAKSRAAVG